MRAHHIIVLITGRQLLQKSYREIIFTGEILLSFRQRIKKSKIFQCFKLCFQYDLKVARISPLSLFLHFFADIPCFFFSPGRDQLLGRAGQEISTPVSAIYMSFGSQGWTALLELVDTAGPKV